MSTTAAVIAGVVTLAVLAGATVLSWHGVINGEATVGIYTAVLSGGLVGGVAHVSASQGARSALATSTTDLLPPSPPVD